MDIIHSSYYVHGSWVTWPYPLTQFDLFAYFPLGSLILNMCTKWRHDRLWLDWDIAIFKFCRLRFKLPIRAHFKGGFCGIFPPNGVTGHSKPLRTSLRGNTSFEPLSVCASAAVWPVERIEKKVLYFTYLGRTPRRTDLPQKLHVESCPGHNRVYKISERNFERLWFYLMSKFPFSYWCLNGHYNSAALLRCLWSSPSPPPSSLSISWNTVLGCFVLCFSAHLGGWMSKRLPLRRWRCMRRRTVRMSNRI